MHRSYFLILLKDITIQVNHMTKKIYRRRNWCFTSFNKEPFKINDQIRYIVQGKEICPDTKNHHWQGYLELFNPKSMSAVKKLLKDKKIHLEERRGRQDEAIAYCKKDGNFLEEGDKAEQGRRTDLKLIQEKILKGATEETIADEHFNQWVQYRKAFREYKQLKEPKRNWETEVIYIWGDAGVGKSRIAFENNATPIIIKNSFILGYDGEDIVLFDDIDENTFPSRQEFLQLTDRYPMKINIKGGERNWKPRVIYLTSNFPPEETLGEDPAISRRINSIIHLTKKTAQK